MILWDNDEQTKILFLIHNSFIQVRISWHFADISAVYVYNFYTNTEVLNFKPLINLLYMYPRMYKELHIFVILCSALNSSEFVLWSEWRVGTAFRWLRVCSIIPIANHLFTAGFARQFGASHFCDWWVRARRRVSNIYIQRELVQSKLSLLFEKYITL